MMLVNVSPILRLDHVQREYNTTPTLKRTLVEGRIVNRAVDAGAQFGARFHNFLGLVASLLEETPSCHAIPGLAAHNYITTDSADQLSDPH